MPIHRIQCEKERFDARGAECVGCYYGSFYRRSISANARFQPERQLGFKELKETSGATCVWQIPLRKPSGTQFTCFTSTKVQILTHEELRARAYQNTCAAMPDL
jgi:hypothetical protein